MRTHSYKIKAFNKPLKMPIPKNFFELGLNPSEQAVYLAVIYLTTELKEMFPTYSRIAEVANVCRKTAVYTVQSLVSKGVIENVKEATA